MMKVLPLILSAALVGSVPAVAQATEQPNLQWAMTSNLEFTCSSKDRSGCDSHPAQSYNQLGTHRPGFLPDVPADEKAKYTFTQVLNPGKEECSRVGWQSNRMGWVPKGNAEVLTKWKENHSGIACRLVGKKTKDVVKPVWMLAFSRGGTTYATGLYAADEAKPMISAGVQAFTSAYSAPWMAHAICENADKFYGESALGPAGRMVNGHGFATLPTGERVPMTSFMVSYVKDTYLLGYKQSQWRTPVCEVLRLDLRYAPKYQNQYAKEEVKVQTQSGSTLVHQEY